MTTHHEGGSRADHESLVRAWELFHIADQHSRTPGVTSEVFTRAMRRLLDLMGRARVCGWSEAGGVSLEEWSERRVQTFLAQIGALHDEPVPNIMETGRPIWTSHHHWGVCIGPESIATSGVTVLPWRGAVTPGSLVWWSEAAKAYNCQRLGVCMSGWMVDTYQAPIRDAEGNLMVRVVIG